MCRASDARNARSFGRNASAIGTAARPRAGVRVHRENVRLASARLNGPKQPLFVLQTNPRARARDGPANRLQVEGTAAYAIQLCILILRTKVDGRKANTKVTKSKEKVTKNSS
ncbi:MAG: hypothetical protein DMG61_00490 [Acidobacteria bacterium]|nr:MAG: hypothetical protein DMG61_00490 [Acidobacteriota bacterium]